MASICCSPPDKVPPLCPIRSPKSGKVPTTQSSRLLHLALPQEISSHQQVFTHCQVIEDTTPLGTVGYPRRHNLVGRKKVERQAGQLDAAGADAVDAGNGLEGGTLPCAIGPDEGDDLPVGNNDGDSLYRMDLAIVEVDVSEPEHVSLPPDRPRLPAGCS